jgi:two-component system invasion response regulator UvrY
MINVLVADDHAVVRRGLIQILNEMPDIVVVGEAETPDDVKTLVDETSVNVVILDIKLRGGSGLDLLTWLRRERPKIATLMLTVYPEDQYAVRAIRAGAAGFLTKESAPEKLIEAVRKVSSGGRYVSAELGEALASLLAGESVGPAHARLSNRELEVFKLLASGKTVSEIGQELSLSVKTVSTHRTRILQKMEMKTNADLIQYAVRQGLFE